jgi:hypothetical protein
MNLYQFFSGAAMFGAWICGLQFLKFWSKSQDRLFLIFGLSFWTMALERMVLVLMSNAEIENYSLVYLIRLFAFILIIIGVVDKNLKQSQ